MRVVVVVLLRARDGASTSDMNSSTRMEAGRAMCTPKSSLIETHGRPVISSKCAGGGLHLGHWLTSNTRIAFVSGRRLRPPKCRAYNSRTYLRSRPPWPPEIASFCLARCRIARQGRRWALGLDQTRRGRREKLAPPSGSRLHNFRKRLKPLHICPG